MHCQRACGSDRLIDDDRCHGLSAARRNWPKQMYRNDLAEGRLHSKISAVDCPSSRVQRAVVGPRSGLIRCLGDEHRSISFHRLAGHYRRRKKMLD